MICQNVKSGNGLQRLFPQAGGIGGVNKDDVEFLLGGGEEGKGVAVDDPRGAGQPGQRQIVADKGRGFPALFDKHSPGGAPAEGLDAQLAGTGKEVQYPAALQFKLDNAENRFLYSIGGGAGLQPLQLL